MYTTVLPFADSSCLVVPELEIDKLSSLGKLSRINYILDTSAKVVLMILALQKFTEIAEYHLFLLEIMQLFERHSNSAQC